MSNASSSSSTTVAASSAPTESAPSAPAHLPTGGSPPRQQPPAGAVAADAPVDDAAGDSSSDSSDDEAEEMNEVGGLIIELRNSERRRAHALSELAQRSAVDQQMAPLIWYSLGTIAILLREVIAAHPVVSPPPLLTLERSRRARNALSLLKCVASHPETRILFAQARIPYLLLVFIKGTSRAWMYQHLRLSALGVIGALINTRDEAVISHLLSSEVLPLCLYAMGSGCELSRTVSVSILERLLRDESGLSYVCFALRGLLSVNHALGNVVHYLTIEPSTRLLQLVIKCYLRLAANERGRQSVRLLLPRQLRDGTFRDHLVGAQRAQAMLNQLIQIINLPG